MATITELTPLELLRELAVHFVDEPDEVLISKAVATINTWIRRGDGVAVYENIDLGHPHLGDTQFVSFGSPVAQLEVGRDELPTRLPDIGGRINWRYHLKAIYYGSETL